MIISEYSLALFFIAIFPIIPGYFQLFGFRVRTLMVCAFAILFLLFKLRGNKKTIKVTHIFLIISIWAIVLSTIALVHNDIENATLRVLLWIVIGYCLVECINTPHKFIKAMDAVIYVSAIIATLGIVEEITHVNVFDFINVNASSINYASRMRMGILRLYSFTSHSITYGIYCMIAMSFILYRLTFPKLRRKSLYILTYILLAANEVLTLSRSSIIVAFAVQLMILWFCGYRKFFETLVKVLVPLVVVVAIACVFSESFRSMIEVPLILVLAVFNDNLSSSLTALGYSGDSSGISDRFILWQWVWERTKDSLLIGHGPNATLGYKYVNADGYSTVKESIEVQFLNILYRYGIIAAIVEEIMNITLLVKAFKERRLKPAQWESKLNFSSVFLAIFIGYMIILFAVMQNEDAYILFITLVLFASYNNIKNIEYSGDLNL